jgi:hypothetical protein
MFAGVEPVRIYPLDPLRYTRGFGYSRLEITVISSQNTVVGVGLGVKLGVTLGLGVIVGVAPGVAVCVGVAVGVGQGPSIEIPSQVMIGKVVFMQTDSLIPK